MVLKKIITEEYNAQRPYQKRYSPGSPQNPGTKLRSFLKQYVFSVDNNDNVLDIPSIPGARVKISESIPYNACESSKLAGFFFETRVRFQYLECAEKEDVTEIRRIIRKSGLTAVVSEKH